MENPLGIDAYEKGRSVRTAYRNIVDNSIVDTFPFLLPCLAPIPASIKANIGGDQNQLARYG
jgi:hypothetical protein